MSSLILHLSDLHFGSLQDAAPWFGQLCDDLNRLLPQIRSDGTQRLEALVISGDVANYSSQQEYEAAESFLNLLTNYFQLSSSQILIVPGNHDLNWELSKKAYKLKRRSDYKDSLENLNLFEKNIISDGNYLEVPNSSMYGQRFKHFSNFYGKAVGKPYPNEYEKQYEICYLPEQNLLILGLNSAWKLNHAAPYKTSASINSYALTNALNEINATSVYKNSRFKIAVWHHPLSSSA